MNYTHVLIGLCYCFCWSIAFALAKDLSRKGKGYASSTLYALVIFSVLGFLTAYFLSLFIGMIAGVIAPISTLWNLLKFLGVTFSNFWSLLGLVGFIMSAFIGSHFGVIQYNQYDKNK